MARFRFHSAAAALAAALAAIVMAVSRVVTHAAAIVVYAIPAALGRESAYHAARWGEVTGRGWDGVWAGNRYTGEFVMLRSRSALAAGFRTRLYNLVRCPEGSPRVPFTTYREYPQPRWAERALLRAERLRCADCGRVVPVYTMRRFAGESVCDRCYTILD